MFSKKNNNAQGTIEYLVIMAVVVVVSLVVVGLFSGIFSNTSQQVVTSSDKFSTVSGSISIVESVIDSNGDSLIKVSNNSGEGITLKKISVGGVDNNYNNYISGINLVPISLSGIDVSCPCESGQKSVSCEFVIEYLSASGLTKIERRTISVECVSDAVAVNSSVVVDPIVDVLVVDDIAPVVLLNSPNDLDIVSSRIVDFNFNVTEANTISSCTLNLGTDSNTYTGIVSGDNVVRYIFSENKLVDWNISCIDGNLNIGYSSSRNLEINSNDVYQITNCLELQDMNTDLAGDYELMNNIDCSETSSWNSEQGFIPIGSESTPFTGNLDGKGYSISGMTINRPTELYLGLFGYVDGGVEKSRIENLEIIDSNIIGNYYLGVLSGYLVNSLVSNVQVIGNIQGWNVMGGITSVLDDSNIYRSSATCTFNATGYPAYNVVGGLVGFIFSISNIDESFANVNMTMQDASNGGIVGWFAEYEGMEIRNSYAKGIINTPTYLSGDYTGGISGPTNTDNAIINSYSIVTMGEYASGCLYGYDYGKSPSLNSFYDNTICTSSWSGDSASGRSTAEMKTQSTFTNAGWDFDNIWGINPAINNGYPYLLWENN